MENNSNIFFEIFSIANLNDDLNIFISLLNNNSKINIGSFNSLIISKENKWISLPITLGDITIIKILEIIEKNLFLIENIRRINTNDTDSSINFLSDYSNDTYDSNDLYFGKKNYESNYYTYSKRDKIISDIIKNDLIQKLFWLLVNGSSTKKDASLLILIKLSKCKMLKILMNRKSTIKLLINHVIRFKTYSKS
jgi:hypothetical protein